MKLLKRLLNLFRKKVIVLKEINERNGYRRIWKHSTLHLDMRQPII